MSLITIKLAEATAAQLREFAQNTLGMTFPGNTLETTMRARIAEAWAKDEISIEEPAPAENMAGDNPRPQMMSQQLPGNKKVRVIINETEGAGGSDPVPLGVNGRIMLVERGVESDIPEPYFEALKNAQRHVFEPLKDGGIRETARVVQEYPYQVITRG